MENDKTVNVERVVPCVQCSTETYHKVLKSVNLHDSGEWGMRWDEYEIIICQGCHSVSFRKAWWTDDIVGQDDDGEFVYDSEEKLFPARIKGRRELKNQHYLPANVGRVYRESYRAITGQQPILAGMGIRALVEAVCVEKKIKGKDLEEKINNLVDAGLLAKDGARILHQVRSYGNDAAHEAFEIKDKDLDILMDIAENLLLNTYILTEKVARLEKNKTKPNIETTIPF